MLFELLAKSPDVWTAGGDSHQIVEGIAALHPSARNHDSNALAAADATAEVVEALRAAWIGGLRNRHGSTLPDFAGAVRLLEKTPKNSLRIPFLNAAFPDARFIYLYREPGPNISSIIEAWQSGSFVTYPDLPDWGGPKWSMLLIPGWRELAGRSVAEIAAAQWNTANSHILDALAEIPKDRWCAISYEEIVREPLPAAQKLSDFARWGWDQQVTAPLPPAANTLTPPDPAKWEKNRALIEPLLASTAETAGRAVQLLRDNPPVQTTQFPVHLQAPAQNKTPSAPYAIPTPAQPAQPQAPQLTEESFSSEHTSNFPQMLQALGASLAVSTYQAGKLIFVRSREGVLNTHFRDFLSPMGIAYNQGMLAVGAKNDVITFRNFHQLGTKVDPKVPHDAVFLPAASYITGDIRIHEIAWAGQELWAVNTRFSCLCTFDGYHNFVPRWKPPFVSAITAEDRCHLNGLAMVDGRPAYVTCHAPTDSPEGWRGHKVDGGCIVDVASGAFLARGLSMPHSPHVKDGKLWFLQSGLGQLNCLDLSSGVISTIAELPGFTRGLDFVGQYAFIGLSQVRETAVFSGVPISDPSRERNCGVWVVDTHTGKTAGFLRFSGIVQEIFALQVLPFAFPDLIMDNAEFIAGSFFIPPDAGQNPASPAG